MRERVIPSATIPSPYYALLCSARSNHENEICYLPFRMTPYLLRVREPQGAESQLCCVLLAERVHSGYEGNRQARTPRL